MRALIGLVAASAVAFLPRVAVAQQAPAAGCTGTVIYENKLDGPAALGIRSDAAAAVDGKLAITAAAGKEAGVGVPLPANVATEFCLRITQSAGAGAGGLALYNDRVGGWLQLDVYADGRAGIRRFEKNAWVQVVAPRAFPAVQTGKGAGNELKASVIQNDATFTINGALFESLVGVMVPPSPSVAIRVIAPPDAPAAFAFSDLKVVKSPLSATPMAMIRPQMAGTALPSPDALPDDRGCAGAVEVDDRFDAIDPEWDRANNPAPNIAHGRLWLGSAAGTKASVNRLVPSVADFDACVTARLVDVPEGAPSWVSLGLVDRLSNRSIWFDVGLDGTTAVSMIDKGSFRYLIDKKPFEGIRSGRGAANELRVAVRDGKAEFAVNGRALPPVGEGLAGPLVLSLGATSPREGVATYSFRNFKIARPERAVSTKACSGDVLVDDSFDPPADGWVESKAAHGQIVDAFSGVRYTSLDRFIQICTTTVLRQSPSAGAPNPGDRIRAGFSIQDLFGKYVVFEVTSAGRVRIVSEDKSVPEVGDFPKARGGPGAVNRLKVEVAADEVRFFVNGGLYATAKQSLKDPLTMQLEAFDQSDNWKYGWGFDDVKITAAPPAISPPGPGGSKRQ